MEQFRTADNLEVTDEISVADSYPKLYELRLYLISSFLLAGSLALPFLLHQFGIAGQIFLPIYLFALLAGLVYGWHCGLLVGLLTPIISFTFTQMPAAPILVFVLVKAALLGLVSGFLIEQTRGKKMYAIALTAIIFSQLDGNLLLFIATKSTQAALLDLKMGYPGLLLLIIAIPYISKKLIRYEAKIIRRYSRQNS